MCGIFGWWGQVPEEIKKNHQFIQYRGKDDFQTISNPNWSFSHAALKIQSLQSPITQPFPSNSAQFSGFNGEIFNWKQRAQQLSNAISTDIEVAHLDIEKNGFQAIGFWSGFFAGFHFCSEKEQLILYRDFKGIKPLFYRQFSHGIAFSSTAKSLHLSSDRWNENSVVSLATCQFNLSQDWLWEGIKEFPKGTIAIVKKDFSVTWIPFQEELKSTNLESNLKEVLEEQVQSSVPAAWLLSGGLDSSLLASMGNEFRTLPAYSLNTGNLGRLETDFPYAVQMANKLNMELIEVQPFEIDLRSWIRSLSHPFGDPGALAMHWVSSKAAQNGVRVLMSGMGADEYFGGYRRHEFTDGKGFAKWKMIKAFKDVFPKEKRERLNLLTQKPLGWWLKVDPSFLQKEFRFKESGFDSGIEIDMKKMDQNFYLVHNGLLYSDEIGMQNQVEIRVPYLDPRITGLKPNSFYNKIELRVLARKYVPMDIIEREKTGFGCMEEQLILLHQDQIPEIIAQIEQSELFGGECYQLFLKRKRTEIESRRLWNLLIWEYWMIQQFMDYP
jgi:asparagine synthase (glutamine-hydrolysing)